MMPVVRSGEDADYTYFDGVGIPFGGPFGGRDIYRTYADAATVIDHSLAAADGTHPLLFDHGADPEVGFSRLGDVSVRSVDDKGEWIRGQINKHHVYHDAIRQLLDEGVLAISSGSHPLGPDIGPGGHWARWVPVEYSLTPIEANPYAVITSVRSAEELLATIRTSVRGWLPEGTTQGDLDDGDFAWLASDKSMPDSTRRKLPYAIHGKVNEDGWRAAWTRVHQMSEADFEGGPSQEATVKKLLADKPADIKTAERHAVRSGSEAADDAANGASVLAAMFTVLGDECDEPDQVAVLNDAISAWQRWLDMERAEIGTPDDGPADGPMYMSAPPVRAGRRNSEVDQAHVDAAHDHIAALGATAHAGDTPVAAVAQDGEDSDSDEPDGTRHADRSPAPPAVRQDVDVEALRLELRQVARSTATEYLRP